MVAHPAAVESCSSDPHIGKNLEIRKRKSPTAIQKHLQSLDGLDGNYYSVHNFRYHKITDYCKGKCLLFGKIALAGLY